MKASKLQIFIFALLIVIVLPSCAKERSEKMISSSEVSEIITYSAPIPETMNKMIKKDMDVITSRFGKGIVRQVNDSVKYQIFTYNEGRLFVFYDFKSVDYKAVILAMASEKTPSKISFDNIKVGLSTIEEVKRIDPVTEKSFVGYDKEKEYFSIHLSDKGVVFINYNKINNQFIVSKITTKYKTLYDSINKDDII